MDQQGGEPLGVGTFVDARTGQVLVRHAIVDYLASNPTWDVFTNTPPMSYASTDTRQLWCWEPGAPRCVRTVGNAASPLGWDVSGRNTNPTFRTEGNNARSTREVVLERHARDRQVPRRAPPVTTCTRSPTSGTQKCDPATLTSPRDDVDAATANLFAMHNRMHDWSYHLGFTEATWNLQKINTGPYGKAGDERAGQRPAGRGARQTTRNNANQATPPDGMTPVTNMYMWQPVAGGVPAVRGRRLRHDGDRARVHPRDQQPDDRRARTAASARAGRGDGRELVRPDGDGVPVRVRVRPARQHAVRHRRLRDRRPRHRHPQLRHEQQPAQLLERRVRPTRPCTPTARSGAPPTSTSAARCSPGTRGRRHPRAAGELRRRAHRGQPSARATGAGRSWCSTRSCSPPAGRSACWTCATT